jgi:hypothetical protein
VNSNEVSKQFRALSKDHLEEMNKLVYSHNFYKAAPTQVVAKSMVSDVFTLTGTGQLPLLA